ncbi:hypothetical protein BC477_01320 [Clavibacter michiganensis subsp. michiganensis]|uniref:Uncharacterized protein n=1 Tax=Clavibacter michiganensis subsp. michiganensis TaxID=33013 RepID=A0A251XIX2_CLAMM|nr:hypothetical protein BC477_01320 [Clavibacter michiganensis subsp. michiganensis]OUE03346.1 hypothetical protein CMMCAS07_00255 [Clavibacter michiganensis subsp. michiganensis]
MRVQAETPAVTMPDHQFTGEVRLRWLSTPQTPSSARSSRPSPSRPAPAPCGTPTSSARRCT